MRFRTRAAGGLAAVVLSSLVAFTAPGGLGTAAVSVAGASTPTCANVSSNLAALGLSATNEVAPNNGFAYTLWSGHVASFDGVPLEVYLTVPTTSDCSLPLVSWNNGYGSDASTSLTTTDAGDWNNVWFAEQGDATLDFTQRGFGLSCGPQDSSNGTAAGLPTACTADGRHYWMTLDDLRYGTRDLQWLIGDLVDAGVVNPNQIAVSGESMGGELTWQMALLNNRTLCGAVDGSTQCGSLTSGFVPWTSPDGTPLHVAAAVPEYGWYTLGSALVPNGTASDGLGGGPAPGASLDTSPVGVPLGTWISDLYSTGLSTAFFAPAGVDPTANWADWFPGLETQINSQTAATNTALGAAVAGFESEVDIANSAGTSAVNFNGNVPILALQGLDDSLMPPVQAQLLYDKAKSYNPNYPVSIVWGDVGHNPATNPADLMTDFAARANAFIAQAFTSTGASGSAESTYFMRCSASTNPYGELEQASAPTLSDLETGAVTFTSSTAEATTNTAAGSEAKALAPTSWSTCPSMKTQTDSGVASWTWSAGSEAYAVLGAPVVTLSVHSTGSDAQLDARLWLESGSTQTLVSTTPYHFVSSPSKTDKTVTFELPMTAWLLEPGQSLKLEITGDDAPSYEADAVAATTTIDKVTLRVPTTDLSAYGLAYSLSATHGVAQNMWVGAFVGTSATLAGNYSATINWGDGSTSTGTVAFYGSAWYVVSASHTWATTGTFPVVLTLSGPNSITVTYHSSATVT